MKRKMARLPPVTSMNFLFCSQMREITAASVRHVVGAKGNLEPVPDALGFRGLLGDRGDPLVGLEGGLELEHPVEPLALLVVHAARDAEVVVQVGPVLERLGVEVDALELDLRPERAGEEVEHVGLEGGLLRLAEEPVQAGPVSLGLAGGLVLLRLLLREGRVAALEIRVDGAGPRVSNDSVREPAGEQEDEE